MMQIKCHLVEGHILPRLTDAIPPLPLGSRRFRPFAILTQSSFGAAFSRSAQERIVASSVCGWFCSGHCLVCAALIGGREERLRCACLVLSNFVSNFVLAAFF
jgi:ABC-type uncharacterized transport system permease subunit